MRGRRPLPTAIHKARGNPSKLKLDRNEPQPTPGLPPCPRELSARARKEWADIGARLKRLRVITEADGAVFAIYCTTLATKLEAEKHLNSEGHVIPALNSKGQPVVITNPWVKIARDSAKQLLDAARELGLSPSSRTRVSVLPKGEKKDPFKMYEIPGGKR